MEIVSEVTAHLENKPGRLAKICSALAQEKVDIRAITVMEADGPSVLRFVTTDLEHDQEGPDVAGDRVPRDRGAGRRTREPHRGAGQGSGAARGRAYQHRLCLCLD